MTRGYGLELGSPGRGGVTYKSFLGEEAIGFSVVFGIGFPSLRISFSRFWIRIWMD